MKTIRRPMKLIIYALFLKTDKTRGRIHSFFKLSVQIMGGKIVFWKCCK